MPLKIQNHHKKYKNPPKNTKNIFRGIFVIFCGDFVFLGGKTVGTFFEFFRGIFGF